MKKKKLIENKVFSITVSVSLVAVLVLGLISISGLLFLRANTVTTSGELGDTAAKDSKQALEDQTVERLQTLAKNKAELSDSKLKSLQNLVEMVAYQAEAILKNPDDYKANPAAPPDAAKKGAFSAQFLRAENINPADIQAEANLLGNMQGILLNIPENQEGIISDYIGSEAGYTILADETPENKTAFFDARQRPWYIAAKESKKLIWTDVFDDAYGRGLSITCAMPFFDAEGKVRGVAGNGSTLGNLQEIVIGSNIGRSGYAFMMNEKGQIIISESIQKDAEGKIIRENLLESPDADMRALAAEMVKGESGIRKVNIGGKSCFVAYNPLKVLPWSLATVIEVEEAIEPALVSEQSIMLLKEDALSEIDFFILVIIVIFLVALAVILFTVSRVSRSFSRSLTKPITQLKEGVSEIAEGNLDHRIAIETSDEIEDLGASVNKMALSLKEYIADLSKVTAEKERIGAELNVATRIQSSMLPCIFPPFPGRSEFDIFASMLPAKEVGGDFYDFFLIDEDHLALIIADVSGKGVPAALFMVIAKTLIKNNAQYGKNPKEVFEAVNNLLCENNEAGMFVTAFMAYLEISSGKLVYVNAGHNPPVLCRKNGNPEWLPTKPGFVLAGMEDIRYRMDETVLQPGDLIFMYTDGVTEAVNRQEELFTDPRLLNVFENYKSNAPETLLPLIKNEIDAFADGAEQADDITMLALRLGER